MGGGGGGGGGGGTYRDVPKPYRNLSWTQGYYIMRGKHGDHVCKH